MVLGKRNIRLLLILAGLGVLLLFGGLLFLPTHTTCGGMKSESPPRTVPEKTPVVDPTLLTESGETIAPEEIAPGRKVAVVVMKGTWCPVCVGEVDRLRARAHEIWAVGGVVAVVTDHKPAHNAKYADAKTAPWRVYSDHDHDQLVKWGLYRTGLNHPIPGVVFLDRDGEIHKVHRGRYPGHEQDDMILETLRSY